MSTFDLLDQTKALKIRLQRDGKRIGGINTCVTNAETGESIGYVQHVSLDIQANSDPVVAVLTIAEPALDLIADAEIKHICLMCGRVLPESLQEEDASPFLGKD